MFHKLIVNDNGEIILSDPSGGRLSTHFVVYLTGNYYLHTLVIRNIDSWATIYFNTLYEQESGQDDMYAFIRELFIYNNECAETERKAALMDDIKKYNLNGMDEKDLLLICEAFHSIINNEFTEDED